MFEKLYNYVVFGTSIPIDTFNVDEQLEFLLLLRSICNDKELRKCTIDGPSSAHMYGFQRFDRTIWNKLMNYIIPITFLEKYERVEICVYIFSGIYDKQRGDHNSIAYRFSTLKESDIKNQYPLFAQAMQFYKITYTDILDNYTYRKYGSGHGSN